MFVALRPRNVVSLHRGYFVFLPSGVYIASRYHARARRKVFISATTRELHSYRGEIKNALLTLGIFPIEQINFRLAHGPLKPRRFSLNPSTFSIVILPKTCQIFLCLLFKSASGAEYTLRPESVVADQSL